MKKLYILILFLSGMNGIHAQVKTVSQFIQKAQQAYRQAAYLGFQVMYRYSNKNQPGNYIDSLPGEIAMDKNRMRFLIDGVETISTGDYTIRLMKDEKLIYLAKASQQTLPNPVSMLDSALAQMPGVQSGIVHNNNRSTLTLEFPPGLQYKTITMTMDETTGFFQKVVYDLYTTALVGEDQINKPDNPAPYQEEGQVEISFSRYKQGAFNESLFDEAKYFTRLNKGQYEPAEQYKDYRIFLASTEL